MKAVAFSDGFATLWDWGQQGEVVVIDVDPLAQVGAAFLFGGGPVLDALLRQAVVGVILFLQFGEVSVEAERGDVRLVLVLDANPARGPLSCGLLRHGERAMPL